MTAFTHLIRFAASISQLLFHFHPVLPSQSPTNVFRESKKNLIRVCEIAKDYSTSKDVDAPFLAPEDAFKLISTQAIGMVASTQANFMRVIVKSIPPKVYPQLLRQLMEDHAISCIEKGARIGVEILCEVRGLLKKLNRTVWAGDRVLIGSISWVRRTGVIQNVFRRMSQIADPPVANVDRLLLVLSMEQPKLEPFALTSFLVEAESLKLPVTLLLNKSELVDQETQTSWKSRILSWGYDPIFCSVETKEGLDTISDTLRNQITVTVGPSGVGKSSLINLIRTNRCSSNDPNPSGRDNGFDLIVGSQLLGEQKVAEVAKKGGRGRHTTRNVSLLPLPEGGYFADTPGFNRPSFLNVSTRTLAENFPEIREMLKASAPGRCRYNDCSHCGERGCIVRVDWDRYVYYLKIYDDLRIREDSRRRFRTKRESVVRYHMGIKGVKQARPKFDPKRRKHKDRSLVKQTIIKALKKGDDFGGE